MIDDGYNSVAVPLLFTCFRLGIVGLENDVLPNGDFGGTPFTVLSWINIILHSDHIQWYSMLVMNMHMTRSQMQSRTVLYDHVCLPIEMYYMFYYGVLI